MKHTQANAAGVVVLTDVEQAFAVTQAIWRFFANDRVTTQPLVESLRKFAREQIVGTTNGLADMSNVCDGASDDVRGNSPRSRRRRLVEGRLQKTTPPIATSLLCLS